MRLRLPALYNTVKALQHATHVLHADEDGTEYTFGKDGDAGTDAASTDEQGERLADAADDVAGKKNEETAAETPEDQADEIQNAIDMALDDLDKEAAELEAEEAEAAEEGEPTGDEQAMEEAADDEEGEAPEGGEGVAEPVVSTDKVTAPEDYEPSPWEEEHAKEASANALSAAATALSSGVGLREALALVMAAKAAKKKAKPKKPSKRMTSTEKAERKRDQKRSEQKNRNKDKVFKSVGPFEKVRGEWRSAAVFQWNNKGPKRTINIRFPGDGRKPRAVIRNRKVWITQYLKDGGQFTYEYGKKREAEDAEKRAHVRKAQRDEIKKNVDKDREKLQDMAQSLHKLGDDLVKQAGGRFLTHRDILKAVTNNDELQKAIESLHPDTRRVLRRKYRRVVKNTSFSMEQRAVSAGLLNILDPLVKKDVTAAKASRGEANRTAAYETAVKLGKEPPAGTEPEPKKPKTKKPPVPDMDAVVEPPVTKKKKKAA